MYLERITYTQIETLSAMVYHDPLKLGEVSYFLEIIIHVALVQSLGTGYVQDFEF